LWSLFYGWRVLCFIAFFFSSRRRHTRSTRDWSSDVCSSDLYVKAGERFLAGEPVYMTDLLTKRPDDLSNYPYLYPPLTLPLVERSEERRVGKECRSRWWRYHEKKKQSE